MTNFILSENNKYYLKTINIEPPIIDEYFQPLFNEFFKSLNENYKFLSYSLIESRLEIEICSELYGGVLVSVDCTKFLLFNRKIKIDKKDGNIFFGDLLRLRAKVPNNYDLYHAYKDIASLAIEKYIEQLIKEFILFLNDKSYE